MMLTTFDKVDAIDSNPSYRSWLQNKKNHILCEMINLRRRMRITKGIISAGGYCVTYLSEGVTVSW